MAAGDDQTDHAGRQQPSLRELNGPFDCPYCHHGSGLGPTTLALHVIDKHPEHCDVIEGDDLTMPAAARGSEDA